MHRDNNTTTKSGDPLSEAIAAAIAGHLDLDHLARRIADHLRDTPAAAPDYNPDEPHPVTHIRHELGRRGRPMAHQTFQKNYIDTHLLTLIPGPNRRQLYVRRHDWETLKAQTKTKK